MNHTRISQKSIDNYEESALERIEEYNAHLEQKPWDDKTRTKRNVLKEILYSNIKTRS